MNRFKLGDKVQLINYSSAGGSACPAYKKHYLQYGIVRYKVYTKRSNIYSIQFKDDILLCYDYRLKLISKVYPIP